MMLSAGSLVLRRKVPARHYLKPPGAGRRSSSMQSRSKSFEAFPAGGWAIVVGSSGGIAGRCSAVSPPNPASERRRVWEAAAPSPSTSQTKT